MKKHTWARRRRLRRMQRRNHFMGYRERKLWERQYTESIGKTMSRMMDKIALDAIFGRDPFLPVIPITPKTLRYEDMPAVFTRARAEFKTETPPMILMNPMDFSFHADLLRIQGQIVNPFAIPNKMLGMDVLEVPGPDPGSAYLVNKELLANSIKMVSFGRQEES